MQYDESRGLPATSGLDSKDVNLNITKQTENQLQKCQPPDNVSEVFKGMAFEVMLLVVS